MKRRLLKLCVDGRFSKLYTSDRLFARTTLQLQNGWVYEDCVRCLHEEPSDERYVFVISAL
jgi:hypothetical protein